MNSAISFLPLVLLLLRPRSFPLLLLSKGRTYKKEKWSLMGEGLNKIPQCERIASCFQILHTKMRHDVPTVQLITKTCMVLVTSITSETKNSGELNHAPMLSVVEKSNASSNPLLR